MKFPLRINYKERFIPNVLITVLGLRSIRPILVAIDTGSDTTILSYKDANTLQIPVKDMSTVKKIYGIGKDEVELCEYKKGLVFSLKDESNKTSRIKLDRIYISKDKEGANITIIGIDFLKDNNFSLYYNPNGQAYLEKDDLDKNIDQVKEKE